MASASRSARADLPLAVGPAMRKMDWDSTKLPLIPANAGTQAFLQMAFYVYIVASQRNGTLYIGSTDDLAKRIWEHKDKLRAGFTAKYGVSALVWYEAHPSRDSAFQRERRMKKWNRLWKLELIERFNPGWRDLYSDLA